ncbi:MAG TPA: type II toxin-antitoxin system VapC family toxin [Blastocatellia bacterium]|nr:type II toxin-antitoxin system VapC family toxin [Blastocatellia bacterium]
MSALASDTHALVWLLVEPAKLSIAATSAFQQAVDNGDPIFLSAISMVELCYLIEKGRLSQTVLDRLVAALAQPNPVLRVVPVTDDIALAITRISRVSVPDMPDRIIATTALHLGVPLVTRDRKISAAGLQVIW